MLLLVLAATVSPSVGASPAGDALARLQALEIKSGPYAGAFRLSARGGINWYFANIALANALPAMPATVRRYLDAYLAHFDAATGTIEDVAADDDGTLGPPQPPDSHDAYAATLVALAARYVSVTRDAGWWRAHRAAIKALAYQNILVQIKPDGLVRVYQAGRQPAGVDPHEAAIGYLIDNCEVYEGLRALATMLRAQGDADAPYYESFLAPLGKAIGALFDQTAGAWRPSDDVSGVETVFYPDCLAQIYPGLYGVSSGDAEVDRRRGALSYRFLQRCRIPREAAPSQRLAIAAYAAGTRHDPAYARNVASTFVDDPSLPALAWLLAYVKGPSH
jgi:hypothetical protein